MLLKVLKIKFPKGAWRKPLFYYLRNYIYGMDYFVILFILKLQKGKLYDLFIYGFIFVMYYILRIYKYAKEMNKGKLKFR